MTVRSVKTPSYETPGPRVTLLPGQIVDMRLRILFHEILGQQQDSCEGTLSFAVTPTLDDKQDRIEIPCEFKRVIKKSGKHCKEQC